MDNTFSIILKSLGLSISVALCVGFYKSIGRRNQALKDFKNSQMKDFKQVDKMKEGEQVYVKAKLLATNLNKANSRSQKIQIHYNQFYLQEPSDLKILQKMERIQLFQPIFENKMWQFADQKENKYTLTKIQQIVGDPFHLQRKYERIEDIGVLKTFWGGVCYYIQCFFDLIRKAKFRNPELRQINIHRGPFIKGPLIGFLHYSINLLTDSYFVLKIKFQNGFHDIKILAESRSSLLSFYRTQITDAKIGTGIFFTVSMLFVYYLYKDIRKYSIFESLALKIEKGNKKWLEVENADQQKCCIICYTNCRNLILFDCKHLVMCYTCWKALNHDQCPICKKDIATVKVVSEN